MIVRYEIHSGKSAPIDKIYYQDKMEEGKQYDMENFGSNEKAKCEKTTIIVTNSRNLVVIETKKKFTAKNLIGVISQTFKTLAFCIK